MKTFDVIVLGLGAMGSSTVYQLAKRGGRVLGIDQFSPPHTMGSTHGETRITRLAIGEGEEYVPFAVRSHEIWRDIERETGKSLLFQVGGLVLASTSSASSFHVPRFFENTVAAAERNVIPHEKLNAEDIRKRFPQFGVRDDEIGYFEPGAGYLLPEECIRTQLDLAKKHGASLHTGEKVLEFKSDGAGVTVTTGKSAYTANSLVVTAGPWLPELIGPEYSAGLKIQRQVLYWFDIEKEAGEMFAPGRCPVFIWDLKGKRHGIYGFPAVDGPEGGVKIATEQDDETTSPDTVDRVVTTKEKLEMYENFVAPYFPALAPRCLKAVTCLYTAAPGARFLIDRHPAHKNIFIVSPCSGHGFKHSAAIGETVAQSLTGEPGGLDLGKFSFGSGS